MYSLKSQDKNKDMSVVDLDKRIKKAFYALEHPEKEKKTKPEHIFLGYKKPKKGKK
jgi:hypothetical protein